MKKSEIPSPIDQLESPKWYKAKTVSILGLIIAVTLLSGLFTITPYWQFILLVGVISGIGGIYLKLSTREVFFTTFIGIFLAWVLYYGISQLLNGSVVFMNQITTLITGGQSLTLVLVLLFCIFGGLMGGFASLFSFSLINLLLPSKKEQ